MKPGVWLRWLLLAGMGLLLSACAALPDPAAEEARMRRDSSRYIVLAVANPLESISSRVGTSLSGYGAPPRYTVGSRAAQTMAALAQEYALREASGWPIPSLGLHCVVFEIPPHAQREELMAVLSRDKRVRLVQALQDFETHSEPQSGVPYNDPYVLLQRGFVETHAAQAHQISVGKDIRIAVIDTGANTKHPDLQGRIDSSTNLVDRNEASFLQDRHGTEVLGIIGAAGNNGQGIVGMAPAARLRLYKACWYPPAGAGARCNSFTLAKALVEVMQSDAKIINMSLGGPPDELLNQLLAQLLKQGRLVVTALPTNQQLSGFPSGVAGVVVVGMNGMSGVNSMLVPPADALFAPGRDILTLEPGGRYDFATGSSMAAAHVSGMVALLWAQAPQLERRDILDILARSSTPQVDAERALLSLRSRQAQALNR
nr:S8 family serine peptidase [uncultured Albidiferax sp.]